MSPARHLVVAALCAGLLGPAATGLRAAQTVVAPEDRIDDTAARLLFARSLSYHRETWPQAEAEYERVRREHPENKDAAAALAELRGWMRGYTLGLANAGDPAAKTRLEALLATRPDDAGAARAYVDLIRRTEGDAAAEAAVTARAQAAPANAVWRVEWARLETQRGHAVHARRLFAEARAREDTPALRLEAGRAAITWGDFYGAERALRAALRAPAGAAGASAGELRDELGRLLISTDRLEEAEQFYREWRYEDPKATAANAGWAELKRKEKADIRNQEPEVRNDAMVGRGLRSAPSAGSGVPALPENPTNATGTSRLQDLAGVADAGAGRVSAADRQGAGNRDFAGHQPVRRVSQEELAAMTAPALVGYAGELAGGGDFAGAVDVLAAARVKDPEYYPAWAQYAEFLAIAGRYDDALREYAALKQAMPENRQVLLGEARTLAWSRHYEESLRAYAALAALNPVDPVPRREAARTAGWAKWRERSAKLYATAWTPTTVDVELAAALRRVLPEAGDASGVVAKWRRWAENQTSEGSDQRSDSVGRGLRSAPGLGGNGVPPLPEAQTERDGDIALHPTAGYGDPALQQTHTDAGQRSRRQEPGYGDPALHPNQSEPFGATEDFAREHEVVLAALPQEQRAALEEAWLGLTADFLLQREWWLENAAKQEAWDRRFTSSAKTYRRLLAVEPGNEEAWFDLSQVEAAQGLGQAERAALTQLLTLDPNHSLALSARRRRDIRSRPVASVDARYWRERGRGDLSSLERTWVGGELADTFADQYNVRVGSEIGRESPLTRDGRYAFRTASLGADGVINSLLSASASFQHREFYDSRIGHADTGQAQLWLKRDSDGAGIGVERREELSNEFALFQGTRSDNLWLGGTAALSRALDLEGRFTATRYSDDNRGVDLVLRPAYAWTDHPRVFKTILTLEYRDTRDATVYIRGDDVGGPLAGARSYTGSTTILPLAGARSYKLVNLIHPYWTPQSYTHAALTFEWYRDLAREFFAGSAAHYYDLRATIGTDSESNPSLTLEADWHREWHDRWIGHLSLYQNWSREWDATGLQVRLSRRF